MAEKKGSFEAAENYKISYTISKSGDITMKGNNETKVVFQKKKMHSKYIFTMAQESVFWE